MHGGKLRSLVLAAMQARVLAAKFLRIYAAGNSKRCGARTLNVIADFD